jgi:hypothetical protein
VVKIYIIYHKGNYIPYSKTFNLFNNIMTISPPKIIGDIIYYIHNLLRNEIGYLTFDEYFSQYTIREIYK